MTKASVGSIRKLPSGRFELRVTFGGRQHSAGTFYTKAQAQARQRQVAVEIDAGTYVPKSVQRQGLPKDASLADVAAEYRRTHTAGGASLGRKQLDDYEMYIERSPMKGYAVSSISVADVEAWYSDRVRVIEANQAAKAKGVPFDDPKDTATTTNQLSKQYKHLSTLMQFAETRGLRRPGSNPCQIKKAKTYRAKQPAAPSVSELWQIIEATENPMYRAAFALQGAIVIRKGELAGLQRHDISIEHDEDGTPWLRVSIERSVEWGAAGSWEITTPKTDASVREQYADPTFAQVFLDWYQGLNQIGGESFVFTRSGGRPLGVNTLRRAWRDACLIACGRVFRMHSTRSTVLTAYRERGADFRQIQARGGHSTLAAAMQYQQPATLESQRKILKGK